MGIEIDFSANIPKLCTWDLTRNLRKNPINSDIWIWSFILCFQGIFICEVMQRAAYYEFLKSDRTRFKSSSCYVYFREKGGRFSGKKGKKVFGVSLYATIDIRQPVALKTFFSLGFSKCKFMTFLVPFIIRKECAYYTYFRSFGMVSKLILWKKRFPMLMKS